MFGVANVVQLPLLSTYSFKDFLSGWGGYFWPVVLIVTFLLFLLYLVSKMTHSKEYEAKFTYELNELFFAFFAVMITLSILGIGEMITRGAVEGTSLEQDFMSQGSATSFVTVDVARGVMSSFTAEMYETLMNLYYLQTCYAMKNLVLKRNSEAVLSYGYKIFPGSDLFVSLINTLSLPLNMAYSSISGQVIILHLMDALALGLFLPVGILLRFIPGTSFRQASAFMLSLGVGALVVFPMVYVFTARGLLDITSHGNPSEHLFPLARFGTFSKFMQCGARMFLISASLNIMSKLFSFLPGKLGGILSSLTGIFMHYSHFIFIQWLDPILFIRISRYIALTFVVATFIPTLATILTVSFISAYSKFLMSM